METGLVITISLIVSLCLATGIPLIQFHRRNLVKPCPAKPCFTVAEHEAEAKRLLHDSLHVEDVSTREIMIHQAYVHTRAVDILENGPYRT